MPIPLKLVDHEKLLSADLAEHVQERTEKLGHFFSRIKRCRVVVDGPGRHEMRGRVRVRVYVTLPDSEITIDRQTGADFPMAIRESFDAADQRLEDYVRITRESQKGAKRRPKQGD